MKKNSNNNLTLEQTFDKLNQIVEDLEKNNNTIEKMIELYKEGYELSQLCKKKLSNVEKLVSKVINKK